MVGVELATLACRHNDLFVLTIDVGEAAKRNSPVLAKNDDGKLYTTVFKNMEDRGGKKNPASVHKKCQHVGTQTIHIRIARSC